MSPSGAPFRSHLFALLIWDADGGGIYAENKHCAGGGGGAISTFSGIEFVVVVWPVGGLLN